MTVTVLLPLLRPLFVLAKVKSLYVCALVPLTVRLVAGAGVAPLSSLLI